MSTVCVHAFQVAARRAILLTCLLVLEVAASCHVSTNVHIMQPDLAIFEATISIAQCAFTLTARFYLRPQQLDACLVILQYFIISPRHPIAGDLYLLA